MSKREELKKHIEQNFSTRDLQIIAKRVSCRYVKRDHVIKNSTGSFELDLNNFQATSYGWWDMLRFCQDKLVRNRYNYSNSTAKHQNKLWYLLRDLGITPDITVSFRNNSGTLWTLEHYTKSLTKDIYQNLEKIYTPRTWKSTKESLFAENRRLFGLIKKVDEMFGYETKLVNDYFFERKTNHYKYLEKKALERTTKAQNNSPLWKSLNGAL